MSFVPGKPSQPSLIFEVYDQDPALGVTP